MPHRMMVNSRSPVSESSLTTGCMLCGATLYEGARYESSNTSVLCVCIHSAMRCLSARLPYRPHMLYRLPHDFVEDHPRQSHTVCHYRSQPGRWPTDILSCQSDSGDDRRGDHQG